VIVQEVLQDLFDRGEIYRAEYDGWYCVSDERYFTAKDLIGENCPECGRPVEKMREANYFFRMSKHQDWLLRHIEEHPEFIQPDFRRNETLGFLRRPLQDLCISRPKNRLSWGIELPFDKDFVCYVWFDALVNYISAIGYRRDDRRFARWWPATYHLIGKDILTTHTVYWPIMLKAAGAALPETIFAHGWWLSGQAKMSKSLGNVVSPMDMVDKFGVDAFRYFLMAEMTLGQDANFTPESFEARYNADLANDLGNLLSRVAKMIDAHLGRAVPAPETVEESDAVLRDAVVAAATGMVRAVRQMQIDQGLTGLMGAVRESNRYIEKNQPWTLAKKGELGRLRTVMYHSAEALRIISGLLHPIMPKKMEELRATLGLPAGALSARDLTTWGGLTAGTPMTVAPILFPKALEQKMEPTPAPAAAAQPNERPTITIDDFKKAELRVAKVVSAERVPKSDKLLVLRVEIGGEERQVVAGIGHQYPPETMVGRSIVVVANLQPAKIMGQESRGMLLAASDASGKLVIISPADPIDTGALVK
jgi:methionyl-tRNA synthetase